MQKQEGITLLLSDIGGTNTRFHLASLPLKHSPNIFKQYFCPELLPNLNSQKKLNKDCEDLKKKEEGTSEDISIFHNPLHKFKNSYLPFSNFNMIHSKIYSSQCFTSLQAALTKFFENVPLEKRVPKEEIILCISICGPVVDQKVQSMSNLFWKDIDGRLLKTQGFRDVYISNDYESFGYGLARSAGKHHLKPMFIPKDLTNLKGELTPQAEEFGAIEFQNINQHEFDFERFSRKRRKNVLAIGIGTGVGAVFLTSRTNIDGSECLLEVTPSEAGHCFFGAKNSRDLELVRFISKAKNKDLVNGYLPFEALISGLSLPLIYKFLHPEKSSDYFTSEQIIQKVTLQEDEVALESIKYLLELLGQFIHQTSMAMFPDLIILRGPLVSHLSELLKQQAHLKWSFWKSMLAKSHMAPMYQLFSIFRIEEPFNLSMLGVVSELAEKFGA